MKMAPNSRNKIEEPYAMLLDKYLPKYTFRDYHEINIKCSKAQAYRAARTLDFSKSRSIRLLFKIRGLPTDDLTLMGFIDRVNFTLMEEIENEEFIVGFWANKTVEKILDTSRFASDNRSKRLKVVWNFKIDEIKTGLIRVGTETRIYCITLATKVFFTLYWAVIRPFSGLIRIKMLDIIKECAENAENINGPGRSGCAGKDNA